MDDFSSRPCFYPTDQARAVDLLLDTDGETHVKRRLKSWDAVRATQILFFLNAAIWLALEIVSLIRIGHSGPITTLTALIVAILMFGNVGAMMVSGIGLGTRRQGFYYLALSVLLINILLTFTDEFGLFDFLTLMLDLALLGLLIAAGKRYMRRDDRG